MNAKKVSPGYTDDVFATIERQLDSLPATPPPRVRSAREVVLELADKIRARLAAGYTLQQITDVLREVDCQISVATLRTYLSQAAAKSSPQAQAKAKTNARKRRSASVAAPAQAVPHPPATAAPDSPVTLQHPGLLDPDEK